jgi:hypothetical protein
MANKKINQLVLKTTIQPTDLFPLGDATTGQLFKKTVAELQAAIGGAVISVNGLVGTVVLDTDDIAELETPTNRYFTEARARAAISLTTTGNSGASTYSNSTGVLNVPTYTLAGLGGITASFLSGGTGITYNSSTGVIAYSGTVYTDASIRALFSAGTGLSYNSSTGAFSYSGTVYTDSSIRGLFSLTTTGTSGAATYNNTTGVINVPNYTLAGLGGISLTSLSGTAPITYNSSTGAIGITQASTSTNGFLSSTDWNTFNGKQSALTLGNVSEVVSNVLMFPDGGTNKTIGNLTIQVVQAGSTTNGFLSTTDWNTFNNKQGTITLTTNGTSGAATLSSGTLNIPQYQSVLTNPVTGTGTTNYHAKWTSSSAIGNSLIYDDGAGIGIGTASPVGEGTGDIVTHIHNSASTGTARAMIRLTNGYTGSTWGNGSFITIDSAQGLYIGNQEAAPMILFTSGAARMTIASNGSISMTGGTLSDPVLAISGNTSATISGNAKRLAQFRYNTGDSTGIDIGYDATAGNGVIAGGTSSAGAGIDFWTYNGSAWGQRMRIASNGFITMTSTLAIALTLNSSDANGSYMSFKRSGTDYGYVGSAYHLSVGGSANDIAIAGLTNITFASGSSLNIRGQITSGGNWLLGTTVNNGERLYVDGSIRATGSITANSDVRLKKNIERIENALEKVEQISGYTYNTIYDEDRHAGVIAQEIDKVLPEIVNKGNDGLMGVEYGNISALLIEAIKEQKGIIDNLQARLSALEK